MLAPGRNGLERTMATRSKEMGSVSLGVKATLEGPHRRLIGVLIGRFGKFWLDTWNPSLMVGLARKLPNLLLAAPLKWSAKKFQLGE